MSQVSSPTSNYRERLWPAPSLYLALLLIIPAVALVATPLNAPWALPIAIGVFAVVTASLVLASPTVSVIDGELTAGAARIPVELLGAAETLDAEQLRVAIGPGLDARAHLMIRGYIHSGVRVENIDPSDPAPYWVITTRRPQSLSAAIETARTSIK